MAKSRKSLLVYMVFLVLLVNMTTSCNKEEKNKAGQSDKFENSQQVEGGIYPLPSGTALKYWMLPDTAARVANFGDTPFARELQKRTGVKLEIVHPPANQPNEALNIMLASGDLPDLIEYDWYNFPGGPEKAIRDGYILKLNDIIGKYSPNLKEYLTRNPEIDKMIKTDNGSYYVYPFLREDNSLTAFYGPVFRKDWLDELGLKAPETLDEWETVLKAFKEKKAAEAPLSFISVPAGNSPFSVGDGIIGAFGISRKFYVEGNQVKFGPAQPQYKDFVSLMRRWYVGGLIDKSIATIDEKILSSNIMSGKTGATFGYNGANLGSWMTSAGQKSEKFDLTAVKYPTLQPGAVPKFSQKDLLYSPHGSVAITTKAVNIEAAAKFLDYGYGEEGRLFYNFGIEGESYNMDNGIPKYTDLILNNPEKVPLAQELARYTRANRYGPFIQDKRYFDQYMKFDRQKEAVKVWSYSDADKYMLPRVSPMIDESEEFSRIMNEMNVFVDETFYKMVLGAEPLDNFLQFQDSLKKAGIDRAVDILQKAFDRYNKR